MPSQPGRQSGQTAAHTKPPDSKSSRRQLVRVSDHSCVTNLNLKTLPVSVPTKAVPTKPATTSLLHLVRNICGSKNGSHLNWPAP